MRWLRRRSDLGRRGDELASASELFGGGASTIGEQAIVPNAMESLGQDVHEEPTRLSGEHRRTDLVHLDDAIRR